MDAVKPLNYAPKPRAAQRLWRWVYRLIFLAAIVIAAVLWGPGIWRHAEFLYWQRRCLTFTQPADHVVYELAPGKIIHSEACLPAMRFDPSLNGSTVFLHEMRRPDGTRLLVSVSLLPNSPSEVAGPDFHAYLHALTLNEWTVATTPQKLANSEFVYWGIADDHHWKIFAGQPDANNPSHFTFDFEEDNVRGTCDAWLKNDGQLLIGQTP
jgi:hypothetical protein